MDVRIYYEDTDSAGVVYHANYLKYLERDRTEYFRKNGFIISELNKSGFAFPVVNLALNFLCPALYDDLLSVYTIPLKIGASEITFFHKIERKNDSRLLLEGKVNLACINKELKACRMPSEIRNFLKYEMNYSAKELGKLS